MPSLLHPNASITDLLEDDTGHHLDARAVLRDSMTEVLRLKHRLQRALKTGQGRYLCELCGVAVYLAAMPDKATFVFRHLHEDGSCRHITKSNLSAAQINSYHYDGQREGVRHKRIKQLVGESIQCDPRFTRPVVEGTWKGREGRNAGRMSAHATAMPWISPLKSSYPRPLIASWLIARRSTARTVAYMSRARQRGPVSASGRWQTQTCSGWLG